MLVSLISAVHYDDPHFTTDRLKFIERSGLCPRIKARPMPRARRVGSESCAQITWGRGLGPPALCFVEISSCRGSRAYNQRSAEGVGSAGQIIHFDQLWFLVTCGQKTAIPQSGTYRNQTSLLARGEVQSKQGIFTILPFFSSNHLRMREIKHLPTPSYSGQIQGVGPSGRAQDEW